MNARMSFDDDDTPKPPRTFDDIEDVGAPVQAIIIAPEAVGSVIGNNQPPEPTPFEAARDKVNDLANEAQFWLDGEGVKTQAEADGIGKLIVLLRGAKTEADNARKVENEPFDTGKAEVQARYNPVLKRADTAVDTAKKALAPWLQKLDDEKREAARIAREKADALAAAAAEAVRAASATNLAEREAAEDLVNTAKKASIAANHAERSTATAGGGAGTRSVGLRSYWTPKLMDGGIALHHFANTRLADLEEFLVKLAEQEVAAGKRVIPGFEVIEERRAV